MKAQDIQREHFNKISDLYVSTRSNKYHLAYKKIWWEAYFPWLIDLIGDNKTKKGLDAMCGNAEIAVYLMEHIPKLKMDAFDYSDEMVRYAKKIVKRKHMAINVFKDDILKLKLKPGSYDFVVILGGLHHMPDYTKEILTVMNKVLKPGGYFLNLEPTQNNWFLRWSRKQIYHRNPIFEEATERAFDLDKYNDHFKKADFKVIKQEYPGLLGYVLFYNPDAFPHLNISIVGLARLLAWIDVLLGKTIIGKYWSFVTWTLAQKK